MSGGIERSRVMLLAHRGASTQAPENTIPAFLLALEQGADGIELDAKLSADGQIVVVHDATVDRTTGARGQVKEMRLADLRALDAGSTFSPAFAGVRIPTLEEVFEAVGGRCRIMIEITNYASPTDGLADRLAALIRRYHLENRVLFSSFYPWNITRVRKLLPEVPAGLLAMRGWKGWLSRSMPGRWFAPEMIIPFHTDIDNGTLEKEHQADRQVVVWTVNEVEDARRLIAGGVDGIITDNPLTLRKAFVGGEET